MQDQNKPVYQWIVKRGRVELMQEEDQVQLRLDLGGSACCLLTSSDAEEVLSILTSLAGAIWDQPGFVKEPPGGKKYVIDAEKEQVYWDLPGGKLYVGFNDDEDALELGYSGTEAILLPVNYAVELVQIMTHFSKFFVS
ncbi:MAG: hypothetical protein EOO15_09285 [Chitinophagaceae bacterium]|nr:MAG: hypothetical protein EOO15_09285 [Chitinophagaceae bacterium]